MLTDTEMKHIICSLALLLAAGTPSARALAPRPASDPDYDQGVELLGRGQYTEALKCLGRAAHNGNTDAQYQIGIMYLEGEGMQASPEDAAYWFRKAAQNGHAPSQFEIGNCFLQGIGVQPDERMAAEWFWRGAEGGDPDAALYVARMYRDGRGMKRDISRARKYFKLAAQAGVEGAAEELEALGKEAADKSPRSHSRGKAARNGKRNNR